MKRFTTGALCGMLAMMSGTAAGRDGRHLFILSGQSNLGGHRPDEAFTPAVGAAFGKASRSSDGGRTGSRRKEWSRRTPATSTTA